MPGQQKQTNPIWIIWERGELYRKREDFFLWFGIFGVMIPRIERNSFEKIEKE
jgi:hypothetical protein